MWYAFTKMRYNLYQVIDMRLFITKIWNWRDVWLLKWCAFLFGIAAGAYFHDYVIKYVLVIVVAAILLAIRPAIEYWKE